MNCQKNIAKEIKDADADDVMSLKGNHGTAQEEIKTFLDAAVEETLAPKLPGTKLSAAAAPLAAYETADKGHGRVETRRYSLSSLPLEVQTFARAVREHWGVENPLHWVLDVQLNEDQSRARTGHAAENLGRLRRLALNPLRRDTRGQTVLKGKQLNAAWDHAHLQSLLGF